ncbi:MAG: DUF3467 domain-containing protein [Planctomycetales bacterium]|nr:DUF3467 domain-containing protein [Planctomycetales bacterium]NIM09443.1 DUF3467 domain-containing protein [Planctomycetales bacterium]NIN08925.1 DUF3467 domain-containing protein [Planctomycetales bacterium]NIN78046.1 DUF3467 domain-containing protein [Planctomycetales bacterium]NIO35224.1 DUF3467 domain-containing protein [Planctomycetales bacterium]
MAKEAEKTEAKTPADAGQKPARTPLQVEDANAITTYANFCRVTGTPEELIIDVGLNSQPVGPQTTPIHINQRLVLNYYTAKRLLAALQMSIQRHEAAFGVLETDVQKRVQPSAMVGK